MGWIVRVLFPRSTEIFIFDRRESVVDICHVAAIAMCNAEEQLLNVQDTDYIAKKKLYEIMGDGCVAVKNYKKALEYYRKMLEVCLASFNWTVHVFCNTNDILNV